MAADVTPSDRAADTAQPAPGEVVRSGRVDDLRLALQVASAALTLAERAGADADQITHLRAIAERLGRFR